MGIITKVLIMDAIYWAPATTDRFAQKSFDTPITIKTRWEEGAEQIVTPEGEEKVSRAKLMVDRDLEYGGYLKRGTVDGSTNVNPLKEDDAYPILLMQNTPNIKNTEVLREVML